MVTCHEPLAGLNLENMEGEFEDIVKQKMDKFMQGNPEKVRFFATEIAAAFQEQFG